MGLARAGFSCLRSLQIVRLTPHARPITLATRAARNTSGTDRCTNAIGHRPDRPGTTQRAATRTTSIAKGRITCVYYLRRGLRSTNVAIPVDLIVAFDDRVRLRPFRSRSMMVARAMRHYLACPEADWSGPDEPAHQRDEFPPLSALMSGVGFWCRCLNRSFRYAGCRSIRRGPPR